MGDSRNYAALEWVIGEIGDTLKEARQALEAYVEDPKDSTRIRFCLTHIHQVHGTLQMVEFHGASLLAEEMEQLAQALMSNAVSSTAEAHEVLMRSLLQLPIYLDHVKNQRDDHPGVILPLLNDLRAVRKQSYLSETNLFAPDLSPAQRMGGTPHPVAGDAGKLKAVLQKLREMYQFSAAAVLRGVKLEENLGYLTKVCTRLESLAGGTRSYAVWHLASAMVEALERDDLELSVAVRGLLRHLARELRILTEQSPESLNLEPRQTLLKNLLYYVARSRPGGQRVDAVKTEYQLDSALLFGSSTPRTSDQDFISAPEPDAIRSVVVALQDELNAVKHILDISLSGQGGQEELAQVLPIVKRVADTLAVLGIGDLRKQILGQYDLLEEVCKAGDLDEDRLMHVAGQIIEIEHRLQAIAKGAGKNRDLASVDERGIEIDYAKSAVLAECQKGLEQAKDAIVEYIASKWDVEHLAHVSGLMSDIRGGLEMIPLPRPAAIMANCGRYVQEQLLDAQVTPDWETLDTLADTIASIDYYLERLSEDREEDLDHLLDIAEESMRSLGYHTEPQERPLASASAAEVSEPDTAQVSEVEEDGPLATESSAAAEAVETESAESAAEDEAAEDTVNLGVASDSPLSVETAPEPEPEPAPEPEPVEPEEESDIDDEIVEIFIEEAGEVQETLAEFFPQWRQNPADADSLTTVRRAFHTLKGSGRMVEAFEVGELAWSIENLLNRVIDQTVTPQDEHFALIEMVLDILPVMVQAFAERTANPQKATAEKYQAWAFAAADGELPAELRAAAARWQSGGAAAEETTPKAVEAEPVVEEPAAAVEAEDNDDDDLVLWEIFASEAETHLATVEDFIRQMEEAAPLYSPPSDDMQRALHTLKGSAHMAHVTPIAELAAPFEGFIKELRSYQVSLTDDILQLIKDGVDYIRGGLACIAANEPVEIPKLGQFLARAAELRELAVGPLARQKEAERDGQKQVDPRLLAIFMAEEMKLLLDADKILDRWQQDPENLDEIRPLVEELNTLQIGATHANLPDMARLSQLLHANYQQYLAHQQPPLDELLGCLQTGHDLLLDMVDAVAAGQNLKPVAPELLDRLQALLQTGLAPQADEGAPSDPGHAEAGIEDETGTEPVELADLPPEWEGAYDLSEPAAPEQTEYAEEITLEKAPSEVAEESDDFSSFGWDATEGQEQDASAHAEEPESADASAEDSLPVADLEFEELPEGEEPWTSELQEEVEWQESSAPQDDTELSSSEEQAETESPTVAEESGQGEESLVFDEPQWTVPGSADVTAVTEEAQATPAHERELEAEEAAEWKDVPVVDSAEDTLPEAADDEVAELSPAAPELDPDFDEEIVEIFLEEAGELIDELDEAIHEWESDWTNTDSPNTMARALHTLKGGARLASLSELGELAHDYETFLLGRKPETVDDAFFKQIQSYQDRLLRGVKGVAAVLAGEAPPPAPPVLKDAAEKPAVSGPVEQRLAAPPNAEKAGKVVPFAPKPKETAEVGGGSDFSMPPVKSGGGGQAAAQVAPRRSGPQEVIKISAELLEELVNLAGETSISRGRLETQVNDLSGAVDEIEGTISRLQEQLRRLDIETEAQIIFRQEQMAELEDFDPLEMDRYSQLQQLSRSLMESASDLVDLKSTLTDKIKDTETLLLQQSRVNTNLQEGLMRSRMVPFSRLVPRLRRIVRQVASELGKNVSFELDNIEGEMDRSVLERMVAPLEHMLRNAVDHGIELPEERARAGKPETGRVVLSLSREGGDVLLRLVDDGRGINLPRVREKAIERGLMSEDAPLSDHDIMQFILHAGFSTAENVTQISGRGVGMDVVHAEIKQLGGSMSIASRAGEGTEFSVRLPFTVSVNRALMVNLGQDQYAIPLNAIEGIVRVSPFELEHYYSNADARFEYAGENFQVRYLGSMLRDDARPRLEAQSLPLPVVLVRSEQHAMALQVDSLMGSREIVVKSLGQQFSTVQGLSGATVMGDGSVVVILDLHALVRKEMALAAPAPAFTIDETERLAQQESEALKTVMVVDDSVTVRKVTTRFLEREGYNVITAKDGVDALRILQDEIPDVMLLDIEMPRMDGFEVAKNVRTTSRWQDIPIIMITSRTGEKHREHALSLGVNRYMGKPYQEEALLESIHELLGP